MRSDSERPLRLSRVGGLAARRQVAAMVAFVITIALGACGGDDATDTASSDLTSTIGASPTEATAAPSTTNSPPSTATTAEPATSQAPTTAAEQTTSTTPPTTTQLTTTSAVDPGVEVAQDSPFGRRDTPPGGVAAQLELYAGAEGASCDVIEAAPPYFAFAITLPPSPMEELTIGLPYAYCVEGFDRDQPVDLQITGPNGSVDLWTIIPSSFEDDDGPVDLLTGGSTTPVQYNTVSFSGKWTPEPGSTLGAYTMLATQGEVAAVSGFTLVPASEEKLTTLTGFISSTTGGVHRFALAGFGADEVVPVYLYEGGFATSVWTYLTEVTPVQMSERGEGILELVVNQGDPPGMYCVVPEPKLDDIPDEVELGFEYLVDPCWEVRDDQVATTGLFFIDP